MAADYSTVKSPTTFLHKVTLAEGVSFLVLLGIAMPMKYIFHLPIAVKIAGMAHGILFLIMCAQLWKAWQEEKWPISRCAKVFVASLIPFGPFFLDRQMSDWDAESVGGNRAEEG